MKSNQKVINLLKRNKLKIAFAESCTGGLLSSSITSIQDSSKVFNLGLITYSNKSKIKILKISKKIIRRYGAVSEEVCRDMVKKVFEISKANIAVSVTGVAGPGGGTKKKPIGLVYIGIKKGKKIIIHKNLFKNKGRIYIQKSTVRKCFQLIISSIK